MKKIPFYKGRRLINNLYEFLFNLFYKQSISFQMKGERKMREMIFRRILVCLLDFIVSAFYSTRKQAKEHSDKERFLLYSQHLVWIGELFSEPTIEIKSKELWSQALLLYGLTKETGKDLPHYTSKGVKDLLEEMTFNSLEEEVAQISEICSSAKLLKLYIHVASLKSNLPKNNQEWNTICDIVYYLDNSVCVDFGELNIIKIARIFAIKK